MPLYCWKCEVCDNQVEILRPFTGSEDTPKEDDPHYPAIECEHRWIKQMQVFRLTKAPGWGSKGNWGRS